MNCFIHRHSFQNQKKKRNRRARKQTHYRDKLKHHHDFTCESQQKRSCEKEKGSTRPQKDRKKQAHEKTKKKETAMKRRKAKGGKEARKQESESSFPKHSHARTPAHTESEHMQKTTRGKRSNHRGIRIIRQAKKEAASTRLKKTRKP